MPLQSASSPAQAGTASAETQAPIPAAPPPPPSPVFFPLSWLLEHAALPIKHRAATEVAREPNELVRATDWMPYAHPPALALALAQRPDGSWGDSMLGTPGPRQPWPTGIGTIQAVRRMVEYGWDRESPPLMLARRLLFRLLAEDEDPAFLYEFAKEAGKDEDLIWRGRSILREAAAAALAAAGYERDPRLRGAALRILARVSEYARSPLAQKPWVRVGNKQVLSADAVPPSIHMLTMLAYMPLLCAEHAEEVDRIFDYIAQPVPRQEPIQLVGDHMVEQPHLVLGDPLPHRNAADQDVPAAIVWLELMARLGFLRRSEHWQKLFERFLDDRDREGVWHPHKGTDTPESANPHVWPLFPLDDAREDGRWTDVTFRLGLIARLAGRPIELG